MHRWLIRGVRVAVGVLALVAATTALADVTVIGRYHLVGGDTLTRATYYTPQRARVTAPDGREFIYDVKDKQVTVIDHRGKTYWRGSIERADTLATEILSARRKQVSAAIEADPEKWRAFSQAFNDSLQVIKTDESREIAGYACTKWVLRAGPYATHERWVARALVVSDYGPELEKLVSASIMDPLGRVLMRQLIAMRTQDGIPLASSTTFQTLTQSGAFSWEAIRVETKTIPAATWQAPAGYHRIER